MKTSRFIGYSLPGYILVAKVSIVSQSAQVFMPHIRNGELCSVYGSVGILGSMGE